MSPKPRCKSVHPIIRQIIDRDCHVGTSHRAVIRHVISRLAGGHQQFRELSRNDRREFMLQCIHVHQANRDLYVDVMSGDVSGRLRRRRERRRST